MGNPSSQHSQDTEVKKNQQESFFKQLSQNIPTAIAYGCLLISLLYCFFDSFYGGIPIGIILGIYFSQEAFELTREIAQFVSDVGIFKSFIFIVAIAAFIITSPGISLGLFIGSWVRAIYYFVTFKSEE